MLIGLGYLRRKSKHSKEQSNNDNCDAKARMLTLCIVIRLETITIMGDADLLSAGYAFVQTTLLGDRCSHSRHISNLRAS